MTISDAKSQHLTQQELEATLWAAANALRGPVDAGDYKAYVFPVGTDAGFGDTYFGVYTGKPGCIDTKACTSSINSSANRAFWQAEMLRVGRSFGVHILHSSCQ